MREREPTSTTEDLEIEVDGANHRGQRVVLHVSDTEVRQEIRYESLRRVDPDVYHVREADFMRSIAKEILWRLVAQWKSGARTKLLPPRRTARIRPPPP